MTCMICGIQFNYCFYIDNEYWERVVGREDFKKNVGHMCAHCTLEALGGIDWYIIFNEPLKRTRD